MHMPVCAVMVPVTDARPLGDDFGGHGEARGVVVLMPLADAAHKGHDKYD